MAEQRICPRCRKSYWWPSARWQHEDERCSLVDGAVRVMVEDATNTVKPSAVATNGVVTAATNERTANRRSREDYNAYQREYMRKRRAAARAGFAEET